MTGDYPEATASDDFTSLFPPLGSHFTGVVAEFARRVIGRPFIRNAVDAGKTQNFAFGTFELGLEG